MTIRVTICVTLFRCGLLLLLQVLIHIELRKEEEKDEDVDTDVDGVLPGEVTVVVEQQLELVDHDGDKLHQLQLCEVLLPPDVLLQVQWTSDIQRQRLIFL